MANFLTLRYFIVAAETLNFTKAARQLYISQQALSNHISKLETLYEVRLFDRGIPMTLTDAGRTLFKHSREVLSAMNQCDRELQDIKDFRKGDLTIGIPITRGIVMLPHLLSSFHQAFPQLQLHLKEGSTSDVIKTLLDGEADVTISYHPNHPHLVSVSLYDERFMLIAPNSLLKKYFSDSKRALLKTNPLSLMLFRDCPFVIQDHSAMAGEIFEKMCQDVGFVPKVILSSKNLLTQISLCMAGMGIAVVPRFFLTGNKQLPGLKNTYLFSQESWDCVSVFPLEGTFSSLPITISYHKNKTLTRAAKEFIAMARHLFGEW